VSATATDDATVSRRLEALGGSVSIQASGPGAGPAVERAEAAIRDLQQRLTRFEPESELCRLNSDPRETVEASPIMLRFAAEAVMAGHLSGGLVDATCLDAVEAAGYTRSLGRSPVSGSVAGLASRPTAGSVSPGGPDPRRRWMSVSVDPRRGVLTRPVGTRLDSGGIGKGLAADVAAEQMGDLELFAVDCVGDIRFGGTGGFERQILIDSPDPGAGPVGSIRQTAGAVATSGVTRRSWIDPDGGTAHHLIDPASGRPARTGVLQVTALAPTGVEAEVRAKAALLSGRRRAAEWLTHGGVIVFDDHRVLAVGIESFSEGPPG